MLLSTAFDEAPLIVSGLKKTVPGRRVLFSGLDGARGYLELTGYVAPLRM